MKTLIAIIVGLIIGAGGTYFYLQGPMKELASATDSLKSELSQAKEQAQSATDEMTKLQGQLEEQTSLAESRSAEVEELKTGVAKLEADLKAAMEAAPPANQ
jgi:peptidoglycan hydrolase CwlO-like protein